MFGVDLEKESGKKTPGPVAKEDTPFAFADPSEYKHLSEQDRQALTERMINKHRAWADGKLRGNA